MPEEFANYGIYENDGCTSGDISALWVSSMLWKANAGDFVNPFANIVSMTPKL